MKRGTIVLTKFPFTDLKAHKRRPAVVVSKEDRSDSDFIVAFITSVVSENLSDTDLLFDSHNKDFKQSGLVKASVIKSDKLATLNKSIFTGELGSVSSETLRKIDERLKIALAL